MIQEVYGVLLAHNAVRGLMHEAALRVDVDPRRLGFTYAVRVVRDAVPLMRARADRRAAASCTTQ